MMIVMSPQATAAEVADVVTAVEAQGFTAHRSDGKESVVIGAVGIVSGEYDPRNFEVLPGVARVVRLSAPYKLASRHFKPEDTVIQIGKVAIGGPGVVLMAGPCTIESREQVEAIAPLVKAAGATILRGGAFKPRTSPYSFQGMGE